MKILVTGGMGYIGSHVVKQLLEETEHTVTVVDNLCGGPCRPIDTLQAMASEPEALEFFEMDLADFKAVEELVASKGFDAVIHFAAHLQVGESVEKPLKYYMNNTVNTTNLIDVCQRYGVGSFIFSSTAAVYGEPEVVPIVEEMPTEPINPYGMSKLMSERVLRDTARADENFRYVILRYFNVAGCDPEARIGECHEPETHLVPLIVRTALGKREKILMFGDDYETPDGSCIRDYVHVEDLAAAHIRALEYLEEGGGSDLFNCGYGHGYSVKEVIDTVKKVSGVDFAVEVVARRPGDPAELVADNSRIRNVMGWEPRYDDLELIVKHALKWEEKL